LGKKLEGLRPGDQKEEGPIKCRAKESLTGYFANGGTHQGAFGRTRSSEKKKNCWLYEKNENGAEEGGRLNLRKRQGDRHYLFIQEKGMEEPRKKGKRMSFVAKKGYSK